jgi:uncharacterized protein (TIGR03032 family)
MSGSDQRRWRHPGQLVAFAESAAATSPAQLAQRTRGPFWELLETLGITLLVTREYEHLVMALSVDERGRPDVSYLPLPHPSGVAVDRAAGVVHLASTRNPNQLVELRPAGGRLERSDRPGPAPAGRPLLPVRSTFLPGSLYLHELALIGGALHGNAVGHNAVVRLGGDGFRRVWWPRSIEGASGPDFSRNHLQLNSIAAGPTLETSYFSASAERPSARRPGHRNWPVDGRGVIFAGDSREPVVRGLTRPHSARLHEGALWIDNSGYGELLRVAGGTKDLVCRLPGWTRGLVFAGPYAIVGTSRVLERFRQYAPGLDLDRAQCGVHLLETATGRLAASLLWPDGNQVFGIEWLPSSVATGLPFRKERRGGAGPPARLADLFYAFDLSCASATDR